MNVILFYDSVSSATFYANNILNGIKARIECSFALIFLLDNVLWAIGNQKVQKNGNLVGRWHRFFEIYIR